MQWQCIGNRDLTGINLTFKKKKRNMILGHLKRSIASTVKGGANLVLFCAGQTSAGSLNLEEASTNGTYSGENHKDAKAIQKQRTRYV